MQLRTEIDVEAPAQVVWKTLIDFERYPEWNPFIVAMVGRLGVGSQLRVTLAPPGGRERSFSAKLSKLEPGRELRWRRILYRPFLLDNEHLVKVDDRGPAATRVVHGADFSGLLLKGVSLTKLARGFVFMNQALKRRCEGG